MLKETMTLKNLKLAISKLKSGYKENLSELERDGIIQRFEFTVELCWNSSKKVLQTNGIKTDSPKDVFRELGKNGWIPNVEIWFDYLVARNKSSHIYNEQMALDLLKIIPKFISDAENLLLTLEKHLK